MSVEEIPGFPFHTEVGGEQLRLTELIALEPIRSPDGNYELLLRVVSFRPSPDGGRREDFFLLPLASGEKFLEHVRRGVAAAAGAAEKARSHE